MSEMANDIINGNCCAICGQYFYNHNCLENYSHGYPVACYDCFTKDCGYPKATAETF